MEQFMELAKIIGPTAAVLAVITWKLFEKINTSDAFVRDKLTSVIEENTKAITRLDVRIKSRPCLIGGDDDTNGNSGNTPLGGIPRMERDR